MDDRIFFDIIVVVTHKELSSKNFDFLENFWN